MLSLGRSAVLAFRDQPLVQVRITIALLLAAIVALALSVVPVSSQGSTPQITQLTNGLPGDFPRVLGPTRDGSRVVFWDGRLMSVRNDGTDLKQITPPGLNVILDSHFGTRVSHFGGSKAVFVGCQAPCGWSNLGQPGNLFVVNADGTGFRPLTADGDGVGVAYEGARISADGQKIMFVRSEAGFRISNLFMMNSDGTNQQPLAVPQTGLLNLLAPSLGGSSLSSDGSILAYPCVSSVSGQFNRICLINTDGTGFREFTDGGFPVLSGDGSRLAYAAPSPQGLAVIRTDGTGFRLLDTRPAAGWSITFDGAVICYAPQVDFQSFGVSCINTDGSNPRDISTVNSLQPGISENGAVLSFNSTGDLDPGKNVDGSWEVFGARLGSSTTLMSGNGPIGTRDLNTQFTLDGGATWEDAYIVAPFPPGFPPYDVIPGTQYVNWNPDISAGPFNAARRYRTRFVLPAGFTQPSLAISIHADNVATIFLNGVQVGQQPFVEIVSNFSNPAEVFTVTDPSLFQAGTNTIEFDIHNFTGPTAFDYKALLSFLPAAVPPPTITAITPSSGPTTGGTLVTINGTGFATGAGVTIGGAAALNVTVVDATTITALTPPRTTPGLVDVVVTNPDGQAATLASSFTFVVPVPAPTIASISPTAGPQAGGTPVTITGTDFQDGATATFDGVAATNVFFVNAATLQAVTPAHPAGLVDVIVTNPDGQWARRMNAFTFCSPPDSIVADTVNAVPIADALIRDAILNNCTRAAAVTLRNFSTLWLGIERITRPIDATLEPNLLLGIEGQWAQLGMIPPCKTPATQNPFGLPSSCTMPGLAAWNVGFNSAGTVTYTVSLTGLSALITLADVGLSSLGLNPTQILNLAEALSSVRGFQEAVSCLMDGTRTPLQSVSCATSSLAAMVRDRSQLIQIRSAFQAAGLNVTITFVIRYIGGIILRLPQIAGSLTSYSATVLTTEQPGVLSIKIDGR